MSFGTSGMSLSAIADEIDRLDMSSQEEVVTESEEWDEDDSGNENEGDQSTEDHGWVYEIGDKENFANRQFIFTGPAPGPTHPVLNGYQALKLFIDDEIVSLVVSRFNSFAANTRKPKRRKTYSPPLTLTSELFWKWIAVVILIQIHGKANIRDNWSTDWLLHTPCFRDIMGVDTFEEILSGLHFADDNEGDKVDKFGKIRELFDMFNKNFSTAYNLEREISIDESMLLWKGHHSLQRYIPSKRHRWGFKIYCLAESRTGYVWSMLVDEGKNTKAADIVGIQKPGQVVMELMKPILGRGHCLGVDNFYTDASLFELLLEHKTDCVGTVRKNRRFLPKKIMHTKWKKKEDRGKVNCAYKGRLILCNYLDKRDVRIMSSVGTGDNVGKKPEVIHIYNKLMPGVDLGDQKRHGSEIARTRLKR